MTLGRCVLATTLAMVACRDPAPPPDPTRGAADGTARGVGRSAAGRAVQPGRVSLGPGRPRCRRQLRRVPLASHPGSRTQTHRHDPPRFVPPAGFARVRVAPNSFAGWLRDLPLAAPETPVRAYDGRVLHAATDSRIAGVVALDVSPADLQQCADSVMRLHAEWLWSKGERNMSYRAAAGLALPWSRWSRGERIVPSGANIQWVPAGKPVSDHAAFRKYLDAVFAWANTVSLEKQAKPVEPDQIRAGDFFILPGNPGHAVLVLDVAEKGDERVALLGQSFMPAQNTQVLRPADGGPWFRLDPSKAVDTPFWKPFPWASLRRLPE